jgi:hypothetical protein
MRLLALGISCVALAAMFGAVGCDGGGPSSPADRCTDSDSGTDTFPAMTDCDGGALDTTANLCWQEPPEANLMTWDDGIIHCNGLSLGGHTDWRLPSISELRSLVRGNTATETNGACGVTDDCARLDCWNDRCEAYCWQQDPGVHGCYWDQALTGKCDFYWSSSAPILYPDTWDAWLIDFSVGAVYVFTKVNNSYVRCVRSLTTRRGG